MILGIDPGSRRIGIAAAESSTRLAYPVEVVDAERIDPVERISALVSELGAEAVVVGRPLGLSGRPGPAAARQAELVAALKAELAVPVLEHDERLTTVIADRAMRSAGAGRGARRRRADAVAAQVMLQGYLDSRPA